MNSEEIQRLKQRELDQYKEEQGSTEPPITSREAKSDRADDWSKGRSKKATFKKHI
jgi:hypothetical protein